jgi:hypothetical protein
MGLPLVQSPMTDSYFFYKPIWDNDHNCEYEREIACSSIGVCEGGLLACFRIEGDCLGVALDRLLELGGMEEFVPAHLGCVPKRNPFLNR